MSRDALIVGINQYQRLPRLTAAAKDAEGMASLLETHGDFRVRRLPEVIDDQRPMVGLQTSVSAQQLEDSLVRLLLPKGDHVPEAAFFYFSGHGLQREAGIREGYLAASDTCLETSNHGLSLSWLRRLIRHSPVRQIIVILDCCHSGEFLSLKDEVWQGGEGQSYLFIAASREYEEAYESLSGDYSVLTQALLSSLSPHQSPSGRVTSTDLVASMANQLSHEIQQPLFEQGGSEIVITHQRERTLPQLDSLSVVSRLKQLSFNFCPYRGSQPFEEKHADYYFGRESLIQELLQTLQHQRTCVLLGASASGKTSLLRAGLMARLAKGKDLPGSETYVVRYLTPGTHPLKNLAAAVVMADQGVELASQLLQAEDILQRDVNGLVHLVTAGLIKQPGQFWLIIDQFEDLLTTTTDPLIQKERQQVIKLLWTALQSSSDVLRVIIGLRSDAIDSLLSHEELFSCLASNMLLVPPMTYQEIRTVIEKPAEKVGLTIDPYLVHNLTLDLSGAPGELALLQGTMHELWRQRTLIQQGAPCLSLDNYMKMGRLSQLLTSRATAVYKSLSFEEQAAAKRIFLALCDLGEGRVDQCRHAHRLELINQRFSEELIEGTLHKLIAARLVVSDKTITVPVPSREGTMMPSVAWESCHHNDNDTTDVKRWLVTHWPTTIAESPELLTLAHKSLLSDWSLLRQWLTIDRGVLRQQRDLEDRAKVWHQRGESVCADYLLGAQYLKDVSRFLLAHHRDLSTLAQRFVSLSRRMVLMQRWRVCGVAVLLPLAMMVGMTTSLVRYQLSPAGRTDKASNVSMLSVRQPASLVDQPLQPWLPDYWGILGVNRLAVTSQILEFTRTYPQADLTTLSVAQLSRLVTPKAMVFGATSLPDRQKVMVNLEASR